MDGERMRVTNNILTTRWFRQQWWIIYHTQLLNADLQNEHNFVEGKWFGN